MGRVTRIEPDQVVLASGTVNMKRFERRTNEILVLTELLDRTVTIRENGQSASIVDAAMEPNRTRDWVISRLAVRTQHPRLSRRRGELFQVEWNEVDGLAAAETEQGTDALLATLSDMRAADVATALQDMPAKRRIEVGRRARRRAARRRAAGAGRGRPGRAAARSSRTSAPPTCSRRWTTTTPPTCSARCPAADQERLLELMEPEEAEPVRRLMTYADYTAGGMMTSEPVILLPDATVAEALALGCATRSCPPALAAQVFVVRPPQAHAHRPVPRHRAHPAAAARAAVRAGQRRVREGHRRAASGGADRARSPGTWRPTTSSRRRSSTSTTGCSARCRSTTCSTTCCPRAGATSTGTSRRGGSGRRCAMADRRTRLDQPKVAARAAAALRRRGVRPLDRADRALPRHRPLPRRTRRC